MKRILTLLLCIVLITGTQATLAYAARPMSRWKQRGLS